MKTFIATATAWFMLACMPCSAQNATPPTTPAGEPNVKHTVIDDDSTRIDETKVRGQPQRITVKPKIAALRGYEIITGDGSRDLGDGANTSRGAVGKRVWNVLSF
jgi:hypothetical protein